MSVVEMATVLRLARAAAFKACRVRGAAAWFWLEDVAQDVASIVWQAQQRGHGSGPLQYAQYAHRSLCAYVGDLRWEGRALLHVPLEQAPERSVTPSEVAPLVLWRLQRIWEDLTQAQKAGALSLLMGGEYGSLAAAAAEYRVNSEAAQNGREAVLARIGARA